MAKWLEKWETQESWQVEMLMEAEAVSESIGSGSKAKTYKSL